MSTVDPIIDVETLLFFEKQPSALSIYACFAERLYEQFPDTKRRVQKTQITFSNRYVFACISFPLAAFPIGVRAGRCQIRAISRQMDNTYCDRKHVRD